MNKYKWLPSEPTNEMTNAASINNGWARSFYIDMWKAAPEVEKESINLRFPTMLRKMWSSSEVQEWIDNQQPLYTHPQPKREPLSDDEVKAIFSTTTIPLGRSDLRTVIRMVEKAHDIGI
jgi:hypothetical protein